jgi:hypothetical protein
MDLSEILKLSVEERLELMAKIWNTIPREQGLDNVESWQLRLAKQRLEEHRREGGGVPARQAAEEARKRLERKK